MLMQAKLVKIQLKNYINEFYVGVAPLGHPWKTKKRGNKNGKSKNSKNYKKKT